MADPKTPGYSGPKLTAAQIRVLRKIADANDAHTVTLRRLRTAGLLEIRNGYSITPTGRAALEAHDG